MTEIVPEKVSLSDRVIAVMGLTGAGKSTFVEMATCGRGQTINHKLRPDSPTIRAVRTMHPSKHCSVVFIDTPGFDSSSSSDEKVLVMVAEWLQRIPRRNSKLAGIIFLHRITDRRINQATMKTAVVLENVSGKNAMKRVVLATTMWGDLKHEVAVNKEGELKDGLWKEMLSCGSATMRFDHSHESAWNIVDSIALDDPIPTALEQEMAEGKAIEQTTAGRASMAKHWTWGSFWKRFMRSFSDADL